MIWTIIKILIILYIIFGVVIGWRLLVEEKPKQDIGALFLFIGGVIFGPALFVMMYFVLCWWKLGDFLSKRK